MARVRRAGRRVPLWVLLGLLPVPLAAGRAGEPVKAEQPPVTPQVATPTKAGPSSAAPGAVTPGNPNLKQLQLPANPKVMVIPVSDEESTRYGMIDPWEAKFVTRRLEEAKRERYDLVILEVDTLGGLIHACDRINKEVASCGVPVIAFIQGNAFSGGSLISLGCRAIVMAPGTNIGGAQAVGLTGQLAKDEREKARSWLVADVKGLCEKYGYPVAIAQGMVDMEIEVVETDDPAHRFMTDGELDEWKKNETARGPAPRVVAVWKKKDEILTLTAQQAYDCGLASVIAPDEKSLFAAMSVTPATVYVDHVTTAERIGRFLGNPIVLILLVVAAVIALIYELKAGGHGLGYMAFVLCMVLFFWLTFLADSAGALELILFFVGVLLLGAELFLWPGFGVTGVAGICFVSLSVVSAFIPAGTLPNLWQDSGDRNPFQMEVLKAGLFWAAMMLLTIIALGVGVIAAGVRLPGISLLALRADVHPLPQQTQPAAAPPPAVAEPDLAALVGQEGLAESVLRPAGKVRIAGVSYEAIAEGSWIEAGRTVRVLEVRATGLLVRAVS